ncbi:WD40 repeat domain-containing protein [Streptomyces sp. NPDC101455]|uniref:WD40 repeat domain-containing protein n=1 Tax=Streptomyces sp. NPDC101455 TaxID=3366142 RepID=UPI0037F8711B
MRTPWARRRGERRAKEYWERQTGHKDWGDDRIGRALQSLDHSDRGGWDSLHARRLSAVPPGVELSVNELTEAWGSVGHARYSHIHTTLGLFEHLHRAGLMSIRKTDDGKRWLTVPQGLHERLKSRWPAEEAADWHAQLTHNAFALLKKPGDPWQTLPAGAEYWWRHLVWHLQHFDPAQAAGLVASQGWQTARIQRFGARSLLADLAVVDSPESRATASVINEFMSGEEPGSGLDPGKRTELLRALGHGRPTSGGPRGAQPQPRPTVHAVLRLQSSPWDFALSPDATWLVVVGRKGLIHVYDLETQSLRRVIHGPSDTVHHCGVSPDGSFIMTSTVGEKAQAWDAVSGEEKLHFKVGTVGESVHGPDGMWVAYNTFTGSFVDPLTNERRGTKPTTKGMSHLALAADGSTLAARGLGRQILLWDPRSGRLLAELPDRPFEVHRLGLAEDASWIAIGDVSSLRILELPTQRERFTLKQSGTRFATTENWLAVPHREQVQIRSTGTGELLRTLDDHTDAVLDCRMSPDRTHLVTHDRGGTFIVWDAATIVPQRPLGP